jgi:hypothetical protein
VKDAGAADGWKTVESRRSRRLRLKAANFQRTAPTNLSGRCFNCFSHNHLVRDCRSRTRCFKCCGLGHKASRCSEAPDRAQISTAVPKQSVWSRLGGVAPGKASVWSRLRNQQPPGNLQSVWSRLSPPSSGGLCLTKRSIQPAAPRKVWRRKTSVAATSGSQYLSPEMVSDLAGGADAVNIRGRSRRRHSRKRRKPPTPPRDDGSRICLQPHLPSSGLVPPCLLGWSHAMTVAEEDLRLAVVVSVISNRDSVSEFEVASLLSPRLEITEDSLVLRRLSPNSFLLVLPSEDMAQRLDTRWSIQRAATFTVVCKRWSRFFNSSGRTLPQLVNLELDGIPVHVWETATVEHLINPFAWLFKVHSDTSGLSDLVSFRCSAWCIDTSMIPESRELWITEPLQAPTGDSQGVISLGYTVKIRWSISSLAAAAPLVSASPSSPRDHDDGPRSYRRFRSHSPRGRPREGINASNLVELGQQRRSAKDRLGPRCLDSKQTNHIPSDLDNSVDGPCCDLNGEHRAGLETPHGDDSAPVHIEEQAQHAVFSDQMDCILFGQQIFTGDLCLVPNLIHRAGLEAPFGEASAPVHIENQCSDHTTEHRAGLENPHGDDSAPVHTEEQAQHAVFSDQSNCNPSGQQSITRELCSVPSTKHRAGLEAPLGEASAPVHFEEHSHQHCFQSQAAATSERRLIEAPSLLVYHRKKKHNKPLVEIAEETTKNNIIPALQMEGTDPVTAKKEVFLKQIVEEVSGILPAPAIPGTDSDENAVPTAREVSLAVTTDDSQSALQETQTNSTQPMNKQFLDKLSKKISGLLATPGDPPFMTLKNAQIAEIIPRRSRRIAGVGVEFDKMDLSSRTTKKVMQALKVIGDPGTVTQQAREDYLKVFSTELPVSHIEALASFFGWVVPDDLKLGSTRVGISAC